MVQNFDDDDRRIQRPTGGPRFRRRRRVIDQRLVDQWLVDQRLVDQRLVDPLPQQVAIRQLGQRVVGRLVVQLLLLRLALRLLLLEERGDLRVRPQCRRVARGVAITAVRSRATPQCGSASASAAGAPLRGRA